MTDDTGVDLYTYTRFTDDFTVWFHSTVWSEIDLPPPGHDYVVWFIKNHCGLVSATRDIARPMFVVFDEDDYAMFLLRWG